MGRLVTFISRLAQDAWTGMPPSTSSFQGCSDMRYGVRGIGVDEETALLIDQNSTSITSWNLDGSAYLLCLDHLPSVCANDEDLDVSNISVVKLSGNYTNVFDIQNWSVLGSGISQYYLSASNGKLSSTQKGGSIY